MLARWTIRTVAVVALALPLKTAVWAQSPQFGTAADAKSMLEKVVIAMKSDPAKTIAQINAGEGGFKDRDIYPTCAGPDGKNVAHPDPTRIGLVQKDIKDATGKPYGAEFAQVAKEGEFGEVSYMFPRPGSDTTPVQKVAFVTKVADHVCIVGHYK
jgi:Single Cache domain 2